MQKLVVIGAGESGKGAAYLGVCKGWDVFITDSKPIDKKLRSFFKKHGIGWEDGKHSMDVILQANCVVKSPGVPLDIPLIAEIQKSGIELISEVEFAYRYTDAKIIAITGSNGKTTTTHLTYTLMKHSGLNVQIAGNVGNSFAYDVAENDRDVYVLELSSFQLDNIVKFRPHVSMILNLSPDHLNRYEYKYQNYIDAKFQIARNQTEEDYFIYSMDDADLMANIPNHNIRAQMIPFSLQQQLEEGASLSGENFIIHFKKKPLKCPLKN